MNTNWTLLFATLHTALQAWNNYCSHSHLRSFILHTATSSKVCSWHSGVCKVWYN